MTESQFQDAIVVAGSISAVVALILIILTVTLFFQKIERVERWIATPGKQLDGVRRIWGNGPLGRWLRAIHVCCFFLFRNIPRYGDLIESRMGDEKEALPLSYKLWAIIPVASVFFLAIVFFTSAWYLGAFDT